MKAGRLTVAGSPIAPGSDAMADLAATVARHNPALDLRIIDVEENPDEALELGVMTCPTIIVETPDRTVRIDGIRSHRAVLHTVLPLIYDEDHALDELRRQLGSPGENFPRQTRRRLAKLGQKRRIEMLHQVPLFAWLSERQLKHLAKASHEVVIDEPTTVVEEGDPGDEFFIVADGEVRIVRGPNRVIVLGPGAHFGELSLLDEGPRSATVTTTGPATLLAIDRATLRHAITASPDLAMAMLASLAQVIRER